MTEKSKKSYSNSKIYCIRNFEDDDIYVGSTTQPLSKRLQKHKENYQTKGKQHFKLYLKMKECGLEKFYIELLEEYPCENVEQLRAKEGEYIRKLGTLNGRIENRSKKEHYEENKEEILQKQQQYHQKNREARNAQKREHREKNKEAINAKQRTKCECECGMTYTYGNRHRHFKSKHHQNYLNNNIENNV